MKKAILCLIFAVALLGQPTGVQVDLSVVSVDSGSGEVCFKADARPDGAIFDGTDDHITVPDHADLNFDSTGDFTIEAWFKADAVGRQNPIVCKLIGSNPNFTGYQMWIAPDNKLKAFICDGSYTLVASSSTITADTWYYAAFTVDRDGNEKVYLNGSLDCTPVNVSGVGNINTDTTLWIGRATHSPSLAFDGTIAEVRISDVARTDAEIADAYADGGSFENDANTIALWKLEGEGFTATDNSGNGHSGTFIGAERPGSGIEAALAFDGVDDYAVAPDHADLNFDSTGDFTIEAWFKADAVGRQNPIVCKLIGSNPDFNGYQLWVAPDNKLKGFICDGSYTRVVSNSSISANNWYYAAFTVDRDGDEKLYLNGALDGTPVDVTSVGNIDTDMPLWMGRGTHSPSLALDGTIAEVRISDVVRSDSEISDAYAMGGSFENDANTIALWHLNEGAGTDISDASGNGHDATAISSEVYEPAVVFDGTDDHITVPDHADLNFDSTGDFTIEAWFKADAVGRQNPILCKLIGSNPNFTGYQLWIAPDNKLKAFICDGSYTLVASNTTVTANSWYYAAFTVDRDGNEKVYLNGSLDCTPVNVSGVGNINTDTTLWIGRATHSPSLAFDGTIAEVRISDIARTDAEIADAYADGGSFENDANTIALWHLNEGSGTTAGDSSGNGHNGTLTNGATWGDGLIVNPIPGATWTTGPLPTPPEFAYDYDWENDATYDLTDAGDSVCHTYTPGDSLWAKVKATTATYTTEDSAEVIVPEGEEEYDIRVLLTEEDFAGVPIRNIEFDESGKPWIVGNRSILELDDTMSYQYYILTDTAGNIDTVLETSNSNNHFNYHTKSEQDNHIVEMYHSLVKVDTVCMTFEDTTFYPTYRLDSTVITPVLYDYPSWKFTEDFIEPWVIGKYGWSAVYIWDESAADSLYPGWKYAIAKNGNIIGRIDVDSPRLICQIVGSTFALYHGDTITVYDSTGYKLYSKVAVAKDTRYNSNYVYKRKDRLLPDNSVVYLEGSEDSLLLKRSDQFLEYSYLIPQTITQDTNWYSIRFYTANSYLLLSIAESVPRGATSTNNYVFYFDLTDSLEILWQDTVNTRIKHVEILPEGNPYLIWEDLETRDWGLYIRSKENGNTIYNWADVPENTRDGSWFVSKGRFLLIDPLSREEGLESPGIQFIIIEGGE